MKQLSLKRKNLKKNIQLNDCITVLRRLIEGLSNMEGPYFIAIKNSTFHRHKNALKLAVLIVGNEFGCNFRLGNITPLRQADSHLWLAFAQQMC